MEFIKRYFETVEEAEIFIRQINTLIGIPVNDEAVTRTYAEPETDDDGIFVRYESYIEEILNQ